MIILDTNVISALMQAKPDPVVVSWLDEISAESVWITSVTLFETRYGLALLPVGRRQKLLMALFEEFVVKDLEDRVLMFDSMAAEQAALIAAERRSNGRTVDMRDTFIAGIVISKKASLVTRNVKHFSDLHVNVVNPWEAT